MPRESESEASVRHRQVKLCTGGDPATLSVSPLITIVQFSWFLTSLVTPKHVSVTLNSWSLCPGLANCSRSPHRTPHQAERK